MPKMLCARAAGFAMRGLDEVSIKRGVLSREGSELASVDKDALVLPPELVAGKGLDSVPDTVRSELLDAISKWLEGKLVSLEPLAKIEAATLDPAGGSEARAILLKLASGAGYVARKSAGLEHLPKELRPFLRKLGVNFGALDVYAPALLKPAAREMLHALGRDGRRLEPSMQPVVDGSGKLPSGYRPAGDQAIRIDIADKLIRAAHEIRTKQLEKTGGKGRFFLNNALAVSTGLTPRGFERLLGAAGFKVHSAPELAEGVFGPPAPDSWSWRPQRGSPSRHRGQRKQRRPGPSKQPGNPFAELAGLVKQ